MRKGTSLEHVLNRYTFDDELRLVILRAICEVEIAIRTRIMHHHVIKYGKFGYISNANLPKLDRRKHNELLDTISNGMRKSREEFIAHYRQKYYHEEYLPLWMVCEIVSLGCILTIFKGLERNIQNAVASMYKIPGVVLGSWIHVLNYTRNMCAHNVRLWDRFFSIIPKIPSRDKHKEWYNPIEINNEKVFGIITVLHYMLSKQSSEYNLKHSLLTLLESYPEIQTNSMGFPEGWKESPIWN